MGRKAKLGLGGLALLSINGTALITFENNLHSSSALANLDRGGAFLTKKETKIKDLQLDFSKKVDSLQIVFEKSEKPQESKLELENLQNNQLTIPTDLFDYESKKKSIFSNIKSIFREIQAYKKVAGIVEEMQKLDRLISTVKTSILATVLYFAPSSGTKSSK